VRVPTPNTFRSRLLYLKQKQNELCVMENYQSIKWESVKQLAARTPFSEDSIYEMVKSGELPGHKVKGKWLFNPTEVDDFILNPAIKNKPPDSKKIKEMVEKKLNLGKNPASGKSGLLPFQKAGGK